MTNKIYRATNESTGEVIEGCAKDVAKRVGVSTNYIYQCENHGNVIGKIWKLELLHDSEPSGLKEGIPLKKMMEWDELTEPIREYMRRRDNGKKTLNASRDY